VDDAARRVLAALFQVGAIGNASADYSYGAPGDDAHR
jgi:hypothetical protein